MAATAGLTPSQFYELTPREFELYLQGYGDRIDMAMDALAWVCANLMNVHIAKGKRIKASDLRPKKPDASQEAVDDREIEAALSRDVIPDDPKEAARQALRRAAAAQRAREEAAESRVFWDSSEGRRIKGLLGES